MRRRMIMEGGSDIVKEWRLLREYTLEEDSRTVIIDQDNDGAPFSITDFILQVNGICDATSDNQCSIIAGGVEFPNLLTFKKDGTSISSENWWGEIYNVGRIVIGANSFGAYGNISNGTKQSTKLLLPTEPITSITVRIASAVVKIKSGAQFVLYGR